MTKTEARKRVARGAAHLDTVKPGWHARIDVGTLTLHDGCGCVVGQLCGGSFLYRKLGLKGGAGDNCDLIAMGFDLGSGVVPRDSSSDYREHAFAPLQDAWIEAIADRLVSAPSVNAVAAPVEEPVSPQFAHQIVRS